MNPENKKRREDQRERIRRELRAYLSDQTDSPEQARGTHAHPRVPLGAPTYDADEVLEALDCMLEGRLTLGPRVEAFETAFAAWLGTRHAIMVNSGSSANLLIVSVLTNPAHSSPRPLAPGDEVLVPALTWSTTLWPLIQNGLVPVLVDADPSTLCMDVEAAESAVTSRTKALFVAHILGNSCDMDAFSKLAEKHELILLEDSCEALGTRYRERLTGTFGYAASFSFYFSHHITTIEGGMVVTNDDEFADLVRCLRAHGWTRQMHNREHYERRYSKVDPRFLFVNIGYNLRPTELQAAFGLHQLPKLGAFNRKRRRIAKRFMDELAPLRTRLMPIRPTSGAEHTYFGFPVLLAGDAMGQRRDFSRYLDNQGIENRPIVAGNLAHQPGLSLFEHRIAHPLRGADHVMEQGIYWAIHPKMSDADVSYVIKKVQAYFA